MLLPVSGNQLYKPCLSQKLFPALISKPNAKLKALLLMKKIQMRQAIIYNAEFAKRTFVEKHFKSYQRL